MTDPVYADKKDRIFDLKTATQFYNNDPVFCAFVKSMSQAISELKLTPTEVRTAAMFACYINELYNPAPKVFYEGANGDKR